MTYFVIALEILRILCAQSEVQNFIPKAEFKAKKPTKSYPGGFIMQHDLQRLQREKKLIIAFLFWIPENDAKLPMAPSHTPQQSVENTYIQAVN